jgi:hypothetical protein
MKKVIYLFLLFLISECLALYPVLAQEKQDSWRWLVQDLQNRVISGSLGQDFQISFQNRPYEQYTKEELMIYTLGADGTAIVQMGDQAVESKILPGELLWFCKSLLEYKLADLEKDEPPTEGCASYSIVLHSGQLKKGVYLYKSKNDKNREVLWQYLFRFGQVLFERVGFRDKNEPILPVCKGIVSTQKIDSDNDGLIDWLRVDVGFYNFRAGDFIIDFSGYSQDVFLSQGNFNKEFFLNAYLLQSENESLKNFFKMGIDAKEGSSTGPYIMDMGLDTYRYKKENLRSAPNIVFKGDQWRRFRVNSKQTVVLEIKKGQSPSDKAFGWFCLSEILPDGTVKLWGRQSSESVLGKEDLSLVFWGCLSSYLHLYATDVKGALFEIGWRIPDKESLERRIRNFQEIVVSDNYHGDVETIKRSLEFDEKCKEDLKAQHELEIAISYCLPPAEKID